MPSIKLTRHDVIIGVDTHKDLHVAVAIDGLGGLVDQAKAFPANPDGYAELWAWAETLGRVHGFGVEGCGSYGLGLARFLRRHDRKVAEVARPPRKGQRRLLGKSDPIDAEHAARTMLSGVGTAIPKLACGGVEAMRMVKIARDSAVKMRSTTMISLKTVLITASDELRCELEKLTDHKLVVACSTLDVSEVVISPIQGARYTLSYLARRWLCLHEEIKLHSSQLKNLTQTVAPQMLERPGVGFDSAAEMMIAAGDNSERIRSESAFAKLCGVCPIPTGSGKTAGRHRLNRGGNRQANAALYRVVLVRMRWHPQTIRYVERRIAEGLSKKDIIRCLKRFVAREFYHLLPRKSHDKALLPDL
jgi:transposase